MQKDFGIKCKCSLQISGFQKVGDEMYCKILSAHVKTMTEKLFRENPTATVCDIDLLNGWNEKYGHILQIKISYRE